MTAMIDEITFRKVSDSALEALKQALFRAEEEGGFEAEEKNGVLNILFDDGAAKFVFTPNTPVRQVWISAQSTSYKLEWNEEAHAFVLPRTHEDLLTLTERLLREQLGDPKISLTE
jgi:iron donor protein CyaY